jgi:hypothetical protein
MYITAVPNRHSPPATLLRESFRDGDKVRTRTLANLTSWAPERIEALRRALKGEFDGLTGELALPNNEEMQNRFKNEEIDDILLVLTYTGRTPA